MASFVLAGCAPSVPPQEAGPAFAGPRKLKNGCTVELIAVSDDDGRKSWTNAGKMLPFYFAVKEIRDGSLHQAYQTDLSVLVGLTVPKGHGDPSVVVRENHGRSFTAVTVFEPEQLFPGQVKAAGGKNWIGWYLKPVTERSHFDLSVGVATGPWRTVGSYRRSKGLFIHESGLDIRASTIDGGLGDDVWVGAYEPESPIGLAYRLVVHASPRKHLQQTHFIPVKVGRLITIWGGGKARDIVRVEMQSRKCEWFDVLGVKLIPED